MKDCIFHSIAKKEEAKHSDQKNVRCFRISLFIGSHRAYYLLELGLDNFHAVMYASILALLAVSTRKPHGM